MTEAVFWIRDGVLIDRMPVNAVAFAVTCLSYCESELHQDCDLAALVNFAFEHSGVSFAEKLQRLIHKYPASLINVTSATEYYDRLASGAATSCCFFDRACELVSDLKDANVLNFITSAVGQEQLDDWAGSQQGLEMVPNLTEILGNRGNDFTKGQAHFAYARNRYGVDRITYVADAVIEIATGSQLSDEYAITPVGYANCISKEKVEFAYNLVMKTHAQLRPVCSLLSNGGMLLDYSKLLLPDGDELARSLLAAGAKHVVCGATDTLYIDLRKYFVDQKFLRISSSP